MPHARRLAMLAAALAMAADLAAGDLVQSRSERPGLFFAWFDGNPVRVYFENNAHLRNLSLHCNAGKDVFSLQTGAKAKCNVVVPETESALANWQEGETTVQLSRNEFDSPSLGVFSLTPPRTIDWAIRQTTSEELDALNSLLDSDKQKFAKLTQELKLNEAMAVGKTNSESFLVIVPGRVIVEEDDFISYHFHHVFVRRDGPYSYLGEIDKPYFFVDLDGTDLPAIVSITSCDGTCIGLVRITFDGIEGVATFSGH